MGDYSQTVRMVTEVASGKGDCWYKKLIETGPSVAVRELNFTVTAGKLLETFQLAIATVS